jgi:type I restriction-modification system DNA methylase subunit
MRRTTSKRSSNNSSPNIGFEQKLWLAADKLRSNMDAAEYKHVVLGLIFLKYISDSFEEHHAKLVASEGEYVGAQEELTVEARDALNALIAEINSGIKRNYFATWGLPFH